MTAIQFRDALCKLHLSQTGVAKLLGFASRTARRWAVDDRSIPECVAILLRLLVSGKISVDDIKGTKP